VLKIKQKYKLFNDTSSPVLGEIRRTGDYYVQYAVCISCNRSFWRSNWRSKINKSLPIFCRNCNTSKYTPKLVEQICKRNNFKIVGNLRLKMNSKYRVDVLCENGHIFNILLYRLEKIKKCRECKIYINEELCRKYFEYFLNVSFKKIRPKWLHLKKRSYMELDGYNEKLKLAFEYQGIQHFMPVKYIGINTFEKIKARDELKRLLCEKNNVKLVIIPYDIENIGKFIYDRLVEFGYKINSNIPKKESFVICNDFMEKFNNFIQNKNGKLLSTTFLGIDKKYNIECEYGHKWSTSARHILERNHWCPYCSGRRQNISGIKEFCNDKPFEYLSGEYKNNKSILTWKCKKCFTIFSANWGIVQAGHKGCPKCGCEKLSNLASDRVYKIGIRNIFPLSDREKELIINMSNSGSEIKEISMHINRHPKTISKFLRGKLKL